MEIQHITEVCRYLSQIDYLYLHYQIVNIVHKCLENTNIFIDEAVPY